MKIYLDTSRYGRSLIVEDTNVRIDEDVSERMYKYTADGKIDHSKGYKDCITDDAMRQIVTLLSDMTYYRVRTFDSSDLIIVLLEKMSSEDRKGLFNDLVEKYEDEFEHETEKEEK